MARRDSATRARRRRLRRRASTTASGDKVERLAAKKISGGNTLRGPFQWAGPQDQYFAAIFLPDQPSQAAMVTFRNTIEVPKDPSKPDPNNLTKVEVLGAAVGDADGVTRERMFVGPKALEVLKTIHANTLSGRAGRPRPWRMSSISVSSASSRARCSCGCCGRTITWPPTGACRSSS